MYTKWRVLPYRSGYTSWYKPPWDLKIVKRNNPLTMVFVPHLSLIVVGIQGSTCKLFVVNHAPEIRILCSIEVLFCVKCMLATTLLEVPVAGKFIFFKYTDIDNQFGGGRTSRKSQGWSCLWQKCKKMQKRNWLVLSFGEMSCIAFEETYKPYLPNCRWNLHILVTALPARDKNLSNLLTFLLRDDPEEPPSLFYHLTCEPMETSYSLRDETYDHLTLWLTDERMNPHYPLLSKFQRVKLSMTPKLKE